MSKEKSILLVLAAIQFVNIVDFMIMMPIGPQLMRTFSISPAEFGILVSSYTFSAGVSGFLSAFYIDKFGRKRILTVVFAGFTIGTFCCSFSHTYELLLASRILTGCFGGLLGSLVLSIISDVVPAERRGSAFGIVMAAFSVASVVGVPLGLFLANKFNWEMPFFFLGFLGIIVFGFIIKVIPALEDHLYDLKARKGINFKFLIHIYKNKNQMWALLFMSLLMMSQFSVIPFLSPYMVSNVGFTEDQLMYIYLIGGLCSIFTAPFFGKLVDKVGAYNVFFYGGLLGCIPVFLLTNLGFTPLIFALIISSTFFISSGARMVPATTIVTGTTDVANRGSFMSINSSVQQLSSGLASLITSLIVVKSASGQLLYFHVVGIFAIACGILAVIIAKKIVK